MHVLRRHVAPRHSPEALCSFKTVAARQPEWVLTVASPPDCLCVGTLHGCRPPRFPRLSCSAKEVRITMLTGSPKSDWHVAGRSHGIHTKSHTMHYKLTAWFGDPLRPKLTLLQVRSAPRVSPLRRETVAVRKLRCTTHCILHTLHYSIVKVHGDRIAIYAAKLPLSTRANPWQFCFDTPEITCK